MKPKAKIVLVSFLLAILLSANFVSAQLVRCGGRDATGSPEAPCTINNLIQTASNIINFLLSWAWLVSILFIVWAGLQMIWARGNEENLSKAKTALIDALLGFIIILISYVLINVVIGLLTPGGIGSHNFMDAFNLAP